MDFSTLREVIRRSKETLAAHPFLRKFRFQEINPLAAMVIFFFVFGGLLSGMTVMMAVMAPIMVFLLYFFLERIATSVERISYPNKRPPTQESSVFTVIAQHSRFIITLVVVNILLLSLIFFGPVYVIAAAVVNASLMGKEFFRAVAGRHMHARQVDILIRANRRTITIIGGLIMLITAIPILGLTAPFIGVTMMVHLFHILQRREANVEEPEEEELPEWMTTELPYPTNHRNGNLVRAVESYNKTASVTKHGTFTKPKSYFPEPHTAPKRTKSDIPYELLDEIEAPPVKESIPGPAYGSYEPATAKQIERGTKAKKTREVPDKGNRTLPTGKRYAEKYSHVVKKK